MLMLPLIAAEIATAPALTNVSPSPLADLFVSACFEGSARLSAYDAQAITFDQLPKPLRAKLDWPDSSKVWKLRSSDTYLYILNYERKDENPQICGIASDRLGVNSGVNAMAQRIGATVEGNPRKGAVQWWRPEQGYMAVASRLQNYTVLQVNQLSEAQRKDAAPVR